jgi:hypothetical protein
VTKDALREPVTYQQVECNPALSFIGGEDLEGSRRVRAVVPHFGVYNIRLIQKENTVRLGHQPVEGTNL